MKGFTLLEILVVVLIFSVILAGIYGLLNVARTNYDINSVSLDLQRQARQGMSWLTREIRQASRISIAIGALDANGNNNITFYTPDVPNSPGVIYSVNKTVVSGKTLSRLQRNCSVCAATVKTIANDITGLTFPSIAGNLLDVKIVASKTFRSLGQNRTLTFSLIEQIQVRNP